MAALKADDFTVTRPYRASEAPYDHIVAAREQGETIIQAFHETMTLEGGRLTRVLADIVAFANTQGGTLYVGVSAAKRGAPRGLDDPQSAMAMLRHELERAITPQVDCRLDIVQTQNVPVLRISIPDGNQKPYALNQTRIYLRHEGETTEAMRDEIVSLVLGRRPVVRGVAPVLETPPPVVIEPTAAPLEAAQPGVPSAQKPGRSAARQPGAAAEGAGRRRKTPAATPAPQPAEPVAAATSAPQPAEPVAAATSAPQPAEPAAAGAKPQRRRRRRSSAAAPETPEAAVVEPTVKEPLLTEPSIFDPSRGTPFDDQPLPAGAAPELLTTPAVPQMEMTAIEQVAAAVSATAAEEPTTAETDAGSPVGTTVASVEPVAAEPEAEAEVTADDAKTPAKRSRRSRSRKAKAAAPEMAAPTAVATEPVADTAQDEDWASESKAPADRRTETLDVIAPQEQSSEAVKIEAWEEETPAAGVAAAAPDILEAPAVGVEIVSVEERHGTQYFTVRDLRTCDQVHNVTQASARKLWSYAINQCLKNPVNPAKVQWDGEYGCWLVARRAKSCATIWSSARLTAACASSTA